MAYVDYASKTFKAKRQSKKKTNTKSKSTSKSTSKSKTSSSNKSSQSYVDFASKTFEQKRINKVDINTLSSDIEKVNKQIKSAYSGWQTKKTMESTLASAKSMYSRLKQYNALQKKYGGEDLSEITKYYKSYLEGWDSLSESYSGYKTKKDYDKAMKKLSDMDNYDAKKGAKKIKKLEGYVKEANKRKGFVDYLISAQPQYAGKRDFNNKITTQTTEYTKYLKSLGYENIEELKKELGNAKAFHKNATRRQELNKLGSVGDINADNYDKDYKKYVEKGKKINPEDVGTSKTSTIVPGRTTAYKTTSKSSNRYAAEALQAFLKGEKITPKEYYDESAIYSQMSEEEFNNVAYYLAKDKEDGGNRTEQYVNYLKETLDQRRAQQIASEIDGTWRQGAFAITSGLDSFFGGLQNNLSNESYIPTNQIQYASSMIREDIKEDYGKVHQVGYDLLNTASNMAPSILMSSTLGALAPGVGSALGSFSMGASASGNAYQEMLNLGYDEGQARTYSLLVGASEAALQRVLGGIGSLGGTSKVISKAVEGVNNGIARFFLRWGGSMLSEGFEEAAQEVLTPIFKDIAAGYDTGEKIDWGEVAYSGLLGALSGGLMEGPNIAINMAVEHHNNAITGQNIRDNQRVESVLNTAQFSPEESLAYQAYENFNKKGVNAENVTDAQLGRLASLEQMDAQEVLDSKTSTEDERKSAHKKNFKLDQYAMPNEEAILTRAINEAIEKAEKKTKTKAKGLKERVAERLAEFGQEENIDELADIIVKNENGEALTESESELLRNNEHAIAVLNEHNEGVAEYVKGMDEEDANLFMQTYDGTTDVEEFANSFNLVSEYAKHPESFDIDYVLANKGVLSADAAKAIYTGITLNESRAIAENNRILIANARKGAKGIIDDSIINYTNKSVKGKINWNSLNNRQKQSVVFTMGLYKALGSNVTFVGKNKDFNGAYNVTKDMTYIDVYSGVDLNTLMGKDFILNTVSHELSHEMEVKSPDLYRELSDIVLNALSESKGMSKNDIIATELARLRKKDESATDAEAVSELVARACEDLLMESSEAKKMLESLPEAERKTLTEKIKDIIQKVLNWIDELLSSYKSTSEEAQKLRENKEAFEAASILWDKMLADVKKVNESVDSTSTEDVETNTEIDKIDSDSPFFESPEALTNVGLQVDEESKSVAPTMLFSERTWTKSEYVQNREVAVNAIVKALGVTKAEAERYVDNINSIAKMIADDRARLDYEPNIDEFATVIKPNSEYKWTVDMSTLCAKRLLFTGTFDAIQKRLPNTVFDSDDIVNLRSMMMKKGYEVACGICYVESTRRELGPITQEFIERYKEAQKTGKPITRINSEGKVVELKKTKEQMETTKDNSTEKFFADKDYTPTLAELNTTDIDIVKRDHPLVYEAYLNFMNARGQAKPKLLETRTEYKGEILKHFKAKTAVNARNNAGGLRVQSFSDFEVAHLIDMMQIVLDMSRVGLKSQAYTKVPAFADVFGNTGMKINLSLIAKDSGLDADGNLIFDDVEGMPAKEAFRLREKYSKNVGTILVGKNDAHIRAALADPRIDFVIPFHKSSWKESLYEALGLEGYDDYTDYQNEKPFDKDRKIKNFQPSEYWDYSKSGNENAQIYLKKCADDKRSPKFPQFAHLDGYWKLLIDFKMYDNDGIGSPQEVVKPDFAMKEAYDVLNSYEGGHRNFPVADDIVDEFVKGKESKSMKYADRDYSYEKLKLSDRDYVAYDTTAILKESTIDHYLASFAAESTPNYAQAYITYMSPSDYLSLTTSGISSRIQIERESTKLEKERFERATHHQPINLWIDHKTGEVTSHEGRHRMVALANEGIYDVPVFLFDSSNKTSKETLNEFKLIGQFNESHSAVVGEAIPFSYANRELLIEKFATQSREQKTRERFGIRETFKYADRTDTDIYDLMGERDRAVKRAEKLEEDVKRLKEKLAIERSLTKSKLYNEGQLNAVAKEIKRLSNSTMDTVELMKAIREVYDFIAESDQLSWGEIYNKSRTVAEKVVEATKPEYEVDDYFVGMLKDLRGTKISLSEEQKAKARNIFGSNWNRAFFNRVTITDEGIPISDVWQELAGKYSEFKENISDKDMIVELKTIIDSAKDASKTLKEYNFEEQVSAVAREIYNKYWNVSTVKTVAEKYNEKMKNLRAEHREAIKEQRLADEIHFKAKFRADRRKLQQQHYEKIKEIRAREKERGRQYGEAMIEEFTQKARKDTLIRSTTSVAMSLNKKISTNSKDVHIPEPLKPTVIALLDSIDFSSKQLLGMTPNKAKKFTPSKADLQREAALAKVKGMATETDNEVQSLRKAVEGALKLYEDANMLLNSASDGSVDSSLVGLDVSDIKDIKKLKEDLDKLEAKGIKDFLLQRMSIEDLEVLNKVVKGINHWAIIADTALANKHKERITDIAMESVEDFAQLGIRQERTKGVETVKAYFNWSNLLPTYAFKRLGKGAMKMFMPLRQAEGQLAFNKQEIMDFMDEILKKYKKYNPKKWRTEIKTFNLKLPNGKEKTVRMPVSYIMSLYCVSKQEDAKRHLFGLDDAGNKMTYKKDGVEYDGGGMTIPGFKDGKFTTKVTKDLRPTIMNNDILEQITGSLTKEQKAFADEMQKFMGDKGGEWGNAVSDILYGIKKFGIENYFPIKVNAHELSFDKIRDDKASLFSILNYGFTKERNPNATQSIEIGDIFDIFANHMHMTAIYNAYALPIFDIARWFNFKSKSNEGPISITQSIEESFGKSALTYIDNLIKDLNGQHNSSRLGFISKIFKNTKVAMVANSVSVALLQFTAYLKAMTKISPAGLLKSLLYVRDFGARKGTENAKKYCGIALLKSQGYFETDVSTSTTKKLLHDESISEKIVEASLWGAGKADELTWGVLWNACAFETKKNRKDLKPDSDEFKEAVGELLSDVIYETQVVDSPLAKSDLMRSQDTGAKMVTMFASEMTVAYNMLYESVYNTNLDMKRYGKKEGFAKNFKNLFMTATAYTLTSAVTSILNTAVQAFRDRKDEEEKDLDYYVKNTVKNFITDSLIIGKIPYVKEAVSLYQGFSSTNPLTLWLESAFNAVEFWKKSQKPAKLDRYKKPETIAKYQAKHEESVAKNQLRAFEELLKSISYVSGFAVYNQYRDLMSAIDLYQDLTEPDMEEDE